MDVSVNRRKGATGAAAIEEHELERVLETWIDELEAAGAAPANPPPIETPARVRPDGDKRVFSFGDTPASIVILCERGGTLVHRGTLGLDEALSRAKGWPEELPARPEQLRALRFAARWFGAPVDAVDIDRGGRPVWGFWRLAGNGLTQALEHVRQHAPALYDVRFDIREPERSRRDLGGGGTAGARRSVPPETVALLARLGRHPEALYAQIAAVAATTLASLDEAFLPGPSPDAATAAAASGPPGSGATLPAPVLGTARFWAAAYALALALGPSLTVTFLRPLVDTQKETDLVSFYSTLRQRLDDSGRTRESDQIARVLSSPELEP